MDFKMITISVERDVSLGLKLFYLIKPPAVVAWVSGVAIQLGQVELR
jgi:hypothetical protein